MKTSFTCIVCPVGCGLQAGERDGKVPNISGNRCSKGHGYALQEMTASVRNIITSIRIKGGELPLANVCLSAPIPKKDTLRAMGEVRKVTIHVPAHVEDAAVRYLLDTGVDMVVTKDVLEA